MVVASLKPILSPDDGGISPPFKHVPIPIEEIVNKDFRMDASFFGVEGRQARKVLENSKYPTQKYMWC